jgi:hypothetical protein
MRGKSQTYADMFDDDITILGEIALGGQVTILFAKHNTGKTVIVIYLIIDGIKKGVIDPENLYYINADDNSRGLVEKLKIAEKYGFHMLAPNFEGFDHTKLLSMLVAMAKDGTAKDVIIILDTLKKFTDLMNKAKASEFGEIARQFVLKGGTIIALAHTNKRKDADGNSVYAGTSDSIDDADCGYIIDAVDESDSRRVIRFKNIKARGYVTNEVLYSYSLEPKQSYLNLLHSVRQEDPSKILTPEQIQAQEQEAFEQRFVATVQQHITDGINQKMKLIDSARAELDIPRSLSTELLNKYTDLFWAFEVKERGAKVYHLLETQEPDEDAQDAEPADF